MNGALDVVFGKNTRKQPVAHHNACTQILRTFWQTAITSAWSDSLAAQVQQLESRGFIVYLAVYEQDGQFANNLRTGRPGVIFYSDASDLAAALAQLPVFSVAPFGIMPFGVAPGIIFNDVPHTHWARSYIHDFHRRGWVSGRGGGNFVPDGTATIAEFLTMALDASGIVIPADGDWPRNYVRFAIDNAFFSTIPELNGQTLDAAVTIANSTPISREYAFYLTYRIFSMDNAQTWNRLRYMQKPEKRHTFSDEHEISAEYFEAITELVYLLVVRGITDPDDALTHPAIEPGRYITRAEAVGTLFHMIMPFETVFGDTRNLQARVGNFPPLDPDSATAVLRASSTRPGTLNSFGATHHHFITPQNGVYIFRTGTADSPGYEPLLFQILGSGPNARAQRVMPSWGSTNVFDLRGNNTFVVESLGAAGELLDVTVTRRGEYRLNVYHYYDRGYGIRFEHVPDMAVRFEAFDEIANRIFFEFAGVNISGSTVGTFTSQPDRCRIFRDSRYGDICIDHLCITPPPPYDQYVPHIHSSLCHDRVYGHICGRTEHCYVYADAVGLTGHHHPSCSNSMRFAWELMTAGYATSDRPGVGRVGGVVSTWVGNYTFFETPDSLNRSFASRPPGNNHSSNIFMHRKIGGDTRIAQTYVHELGHTFGLRDHNCEWIDNNTRCRSGLFCWDPTCFPHLPGRVFGSRYCIMAWPNPINMDTVYAHDLFCAGCRADIEGFLATHVAVLER